MPLVTAHSWAPNKQLIQDEAAICPTSMAQHDNILLGRGDILEFSATCSVRVERKG